MQARNIIGNGPSLDPDAPARPGRKPLPGWVWVAAGAAGIGGIILAGEISGYLSLMTLFRYTFGIKEAGPELAHVAPASTSISLGRAAKPAEAAAPTGNQENREEEHGGDDQPSGPAPAGWTQGFDGNAAPNNGIDYRGDPSPDERKPREPRRYTARVTAELSGEKPKTYGIDAIQGRQWMGCSLRPGDILTGYIAQHIDSSIPDAVQAVVNRDVLTSDAVYGPNGRRVRLIPKGSTLVGTYGKESSGENLMEERLVIKWIALRFPPGWPIPSLDLANVPSGAQDWTGAGGIGGDVSYRWDRILAAAAIETLVGAGGRSATGQGEEAGYAADLQHSAEEESGSVMRDYTRQVIKVKPQIKVRPGTPVQMVVLATVKASNRCAG